MGVANLTQTMIKDSSEIDLAPFEFSYGYLNEGSWIIQWAL